jgi:hypothetical protein
MKERLTTYHCGKAVIKDKNKLAEAIEKLAEFEEKEKCGEWLDAIELAKIAIALQSQKWIPCSERLPGCHYQSRTERENDMSRLIDADAEIARIEEEIMKLTKAIVRWQARKFEESTLYDIDAKIQELQNNRTNCRVEIRTLRNYKTAFDVEKVIEQLNKELELADEEKRRCTIENMLQFDEAKGYARGMACAIEIVKRGGRDEK